LLSAIGKARLSINLLDFYAISGDLRRMAAAPPKLDRSDLRINNRHMVPTFEVLVECELFRSVDWSIGGVHLDGVCEVSTVGSTVEGWLALPDSKEAIAFTGQVLRTDDATGNTVLRFDDFEADTIAFLARARHWRLH
jgi:hypothetical protein